MQHAERGVWNNPEFLKMWVGGSVSAVGSQVTTLALPLIAVLLFNAGPAQTGLLTAAGLAPHLFFGLVAGVWVDRLPRRPIRIVADGLSALMMAAVSLAAVLGASIAGVLMQLAAPPIVLLLDAATFAFSSACYVLVVEPPSDGPAPPRSGVLTEIKEGLSWLGGNQVLLRLTVSIGLANLAWFAVQAIMVPFATRDLALSPAELGLALGVMGPFSLVGAIIAARTARLIGLGPTLVASLSGELLSRIVLVLASGPQVVAASLLGGSQAIFGLIAPLWDVNSSALRQAITPERLLGRVSAASSFVGLGTAPIGALLGGFIGDAAGPRAALLAAALVTGVAVACLLVPSVLQLRAPSTDA